MCSAQAWRRGHGRRSAQLKVRCQTDLALTNGGFESGRSEPQIGDVKMPMNTYFSMAVRLVGVALAELLTAAGVDEHAPAFTGGAA